jgi:hypothetical protein
MATVSHQPANSEPPTVKKNGTTVPVEFFPAFFFMRIRVDGSLETGGKRSGERWRLEGFGGMDLLAASLPPAHLDI